MWDILFAERYNTTPWDVRANLTLFDQVRAYALLAAEAKNAEVEKAQAEAAGRLRNRQGGGGGGRGVRLTRPPRRGYRGRRGRRR